MLGIVVISYHNWQMTVDFVRQQLARIEMPWHAVVVDNDSVSERAQWMEEQFAGLPVTVLRSQENLGFARGNNLGARYLIERFGVSHLLFTNDDIIIATDPMPQLLQVLDSRPDIGVVGPRVVGTDGCDQSPHMRIVTPFRQIAWKLLPWVRRRRSAAVSPVQPSSGVCYWVSGCFFAMSSDTFNAVGGLDPDTFLYSEEPILAERLKRIGLRDWFEASCQVTHLGGCSTSSQPSDAMHNTLVDSNCLYYSRYLHSPRLLVWLYRKLYYK